jgi:hypothetical protein
VLSRKVRYAQHRWGCTVFYIDSNSAWKPRGSSGEWSKALMSAEQWDALCRRHPDVLFVPEHSYLRCYTSAAGYDQMDMGADVAPPVVRRTWPRALKCLSIPWPALKQYDKLVRSFRCGGILLWNAPHADNVRDLTRARLEAGYLEGGVPDAVERAGTASLLGLADDADPRVRFHASRRLAELGDAAAIEALLRLTSHGDWHIRRNAVFGLGRLGDPRAVPVLVGMLSDAALKMDPLVLDAFHEIGPAAVPALETLLEPPGPGVKAAIVALGAVQTAESREVLTALVHDGDRKPEFRREALQAVARDRDPAVIDVLLGALDDPDLREQAAGLLSRIRNKRVAPALQAALEREQALEEPDARYVDVLTRILGRIRR